MDKLNEFFRKLVTSPVMLWNAIAAVIFIVLGITLMLMPKITGGDNQLRYGLGGILAVYGVFRFSTFYRRVKDEDDV